VSDTIIYNPLESDYVIIEDVQYPIKKLNAKKLVGISNMLGELVLGGRIKLNEFSKKLGKDPASNDIIFAILASLQEDMLIRFASILIDAETSFVQDNFDLGWVTDALIIQLRKSNLDKVIRNFTALASLTV
jgi:hypothetical protein